MRIYNVLNLGAGWQSTRILLAACRGELPRFDAVVFADTQWEPLAVYTHLEWLKEQATQAGMTITVVTAGDLRADGLAFRESRVSTDGKRFASIPVYTLNPPGSKNKIGQVNRQCTSEYKIEPVDRWVRRTLLGLKPRQRIPVDVLIRQWFGISDDETRRATFPGKYIKLTVTVPTLFGDTEVQVDAWRGDMRREHVYPLLNEVRRHDRTSLSTCSICRSERRART